MKLIDMVKEIGIDIACIKIFGGDAEMYARQNKLYIFIRMRVMTVEILHKLAYSARRRHKLERTTRAYKGLYDIAKEYDNSK